MTQYILLPLIGAGIVFYLMYRRKLRGRRTAIAGGEPDFDVLEIQVAKEGPDHEVQTSPLAAEQMFASLHGLLREDYDLQEHFSFEISSNPSGIKFYAVVPSSISKFVESQVYAQYPDAHIRKVEDYVAEDLGDDNFEIATLFLSKETFFPIKTFRDFEVDPLSAITAALSGDEGDRHVCFQLLIKPLPDIWQEVGYEYIEHIRTGYPESGSLLRDLPKAVLKEIFGIAGSLAENALVGPREPKEIKGGGKVETSMAAGKEIELKAIDNKLSKMGFSVVVRVLSRSPGKDTSAKNLRSILASMRQFSTSNLNSFTSSTAVNDKKSYADFKKRVFDENATIVLNIEELASIFHLPSATVETPSISWVYSKKAEPPVNLPTKNCCYIGETVFRDHNVRFGISNETDDRVRHMYLIGKSGTGKSTLFLNMIIQDIKDGFGVGVLDPHGELTDKILDYVPNERIHDVVVVDPSDTERPVGINLLELQDPSQKNLMASGLVSAVKQHFDYSWGPRLEYLLNYAILTLLEVPGTTMLGITRLLQDMNYQKYILHQVKDPVVVDFWEEEYRAMRGNQRLITEAVAPIQNKINRFLSSTTIRNILGQRKSTVDMWDIMSNKKILLMNLSKGKIGEDNANLLGALLVSRLQFMAMQRVKIPDEERVPFYLYVDEFQNFATGSFESILSESRKYKLGLYLTHQYTGQLPEELLKAVYGNVGTIASFSVGAQDAKVMETEFSPFFSEIDLISLERFQMYIKLMIDGQTSMPFSARILVPWLPEQVLVEKTGNKESVIASSREKYGAEKEFVEKKIRAWVERQFDKGTAIAEEYRGERGEENTVKDKEKGEVEYKNFEEGEV